MRWLPVLLMLCLLGGIVGVRWLAGADPPAPPPSEAAPAPVDPDTDPQHAPRDAATPGDAPSDDTGQEPSADDSEREAVPEDGPADGGRRALVLRGDPPVPVADAEVLFLDERQGAARIRGLESPPARDEWPDRWGQRVRTDADGVAPLPADGGALLIAARSGDEFAFATLRAGRRQVRLTLVRDEALTVEVVRADGSPAAKAPLALLQWQGKGEADPIWQGITGADGRAVVRHFQLQRRQPLANASAERFAALAALPTASAVIAEFPGRPTTDEVVRLQLPPVGDLEVVLTDHRGTPLLSPAWVAVHAPGDAGPGPFPYSQGLRNRSGRKPAGTAPVLLPFVGAALDLRVSAHFDADRRGASTATRGPAHDGAVVRVELPLEPRHVVLAGRLKFADGRPCAGPQVSTVLWSGDRDAQNTALHPVADGRFDLVLAGREEGAPFALVLRHRDRDDEAGTSRDYGARVPVPHLDGGQRVELGDIVLGELAPLVSGTVVDDLGAPIAGAAVNVQLHRDEQQRGDPWRNLAQLGTRTDDDGAFVVLGDLPPGELRVHADTDRHFAQSEPLVATDQRVALRLDRNGIVRGRALLPDWVADGALSLVLRPTDAALQPEQTRSATLRRRGGGRFTVEPLRPGRFDALVVMRNVPQPVLTIADCFVPPGESRDPRLQELDLRQALFRYRLRAVDAAGQPFAVDGPIQASLALPDGNRVEAGFRWQRGRAELVTPSPLADLLFFGRGFAPQRLTLGPGDHDVWLQTLRPALLELPGARALCGPVRRVRVSVILTEATGLPESLSGIDQRTGEQFSFPRWDLGRSSGAWLERYDTVEVPLMKSGTYEVILRVHATESEGSPQASVSLGTFPLRVDAPTLAPVHVPVDAAAVEQACRSVDERQRGAEEAAANRR